MPRRNSVESAGAFLSLVATTFSRQGWNGIHGLL